MNKFLIHILLTFSCDISMGQLKDKVNSIDETCVRIDSISNTFKHYLYLSSDASVNKEVWVRYAVDTANKKFARVIILEKKPVTFYYSNFKLIKLTVKETKSDTISRRADYYFENWKLLAKQDKFILVRDVRPLIKEAKERNIVWLYK